MKEITKYSLLISAMVSALTVAANEQGTSESITNASNPEHTYLLSPEIIVVTGSRQQSELLTLVGNIDRISSEDIDSVNAVHPSDILNRATGVHIQSNNGMESLPSLRSPVLTGPGAAGAFLFLEDGIATRSAGFANNNALSELNLAQAKEIEIVRGPASAIYGSNAVHGVINALTKDPTDKANITVFGGPNNSYQLQGSGNNEMEQHGVSANIQAVNDGGYRDNSDFQSLKLGLRHDYLSGKDQFRTTISGFSLDQKTAGFISSSDNGNGCYTSTYASEYLYKDTGAMKKNCDENAYRKWTSLRIATNWQRELSDTTSLSLTPYFRINNMEFRQHYLPSKAIEENSHYSIGVVSSYHWKINREASLIMGVDAEWTEGDLTQTQQKSDSYGYGKARQQGLHYDYEVQAITIAPYIQGDWQLSEHFKLNGSLRFDATEYNYNNLLADGTTKADGSLCVNNSEEPVPCLYQRPMDSKDSFDNASTKLGFNYRVNSDMAIFGDWSQGFRTPQTTDLYRLQNQQVVGEIDSEEIDSTEIGIRGVTAKLTYEVVGYYMTKKNFFFRDARGLNVTDGETSHQGIELAVDYDVSNHFNVAVNYSYGQHEYEFERENSGVAQGNEIDTAPKHLANVRFGWKPTQNSKVELEWLHMGEYFLDPANEHEYQGHDLLQLRSSVQVNNNINLFARIENLTDEEYASRADFSFGSYRFFGGKSRGLHIGISASF
jgi:iron complex outermembrane receptor protein